jgi:hypothetical protein
MIKTYLFIIAITLAGIVGWVANLVKLVGGVDDPITTLFVLRVVGIFAPPLGAILGYF